MAWEARDNTGSIFKNNRKEKDSHPDMKGDIMIDGKSYWVSAWRKIDKNGNPWYSFSVKAKDDQASAPAPAAKHVPADDIPF